MSIYDLYDVKVDDLDPAKDLIEQLLSISFSKRDSDYQGGEYYVHGDEAGEHFVLKRNVDPFDGQPAEVDFPFSKFLLYVNETLRAPEIQNALAEKGDCIALVRHEDL